ncbi:hypothetical protein GHT06_009963 [Daphnia sinensis]|uniref:Uncharacterized protein n=1 Tax=Daphnia sinensis TaxID=1820382 RepID=A0AAD5KXE3_9CRUS|nr:hypothetical protein GHT06_009963 [Daphnia sinensis]
MDPSALEFLLCHRGNFDDVLEVVETLMFSLPFNYCTRFRDEDKEFFVELLLISLLTHPSDLPSGHDFGYRRIWIGDFYYA